MKLRIFVAGIVSLGLTTSVFAAAKSWNLFEWMAIAPVVVVAEVQVDDQKYVQIRVDRVLRGGAVPGDLLRVDVKGTNRDRSPGTAKLSVEKGFSYLWLLQPRPGEPKKGEPILDLVRGTMGARLLGEGAPALIDAAERMVVWQDRRSDNQLWEDLAKALDDPNPFLVEAALDMIAKFHRADARSLSALRRLLDSPRADFREDAAALVGRAATKAGDSPAAGDAFAALVVLARRDETVAVRVAATRSLGDFTGITPLETLREIARTDPEQAVRYEAQRILVQREAPAGGAGIDLPARAP